MKEIWANIIAFFRYNWNRSHWRLINAAITSNPYDWSYLFRMEKFQLEKMRDYMERSEVVDHKECGNLKWVNICIDLLDIIIEEPEESPYVNLNNAYRFRPRSLAPDKEDAWLNYMKKYPQDLRWQKAYDLYFEIRKEYTTSWWD